MKKLWIKKLVIDNFRGLQNIELNFNETENRISGRNGTGKTAILDAIRYLIFFKNESGTKSDNYETIGNFDEKININPNIQIDLMLDNELINIASSNKSWFMDGAKYSTHGDFFKSFSKRIGINEPELLFDHCNPMNSIDHYESNTKENRRLRDILIRVSNFKMEEGEKINQDEIEELTNEINEHEEKIKSLKADIKTQSNRKSDFKERSEQIEEKSKINAFNQDESKINSKLVDLERELNEIRDVKNQWKIINTDWDECVQRIKIEEEKKESFSYDDNDKYAPKRKINFLEIILVILTLGLYYLLFLRNRKSKKNTSVTELRRVQENINNYEKELKKLTYEKEIINEKYEKIDSYRETEIINELNIIKSHSNLDNSDKKEIEQYLLIEENIKRIEEEMKEQIDIQNIAKNKKKEIESKLEKRIKEIFPKFDVEIFSNNKNDSVVIKQNDIKIKFLNRSAKMNIAGEINDFLKEGIKINTFNLIDNGEAINEIYGDDKNQKIITYVTRDPDLKLEVKK